VNKKYGYLLLVLWGTIILPAGCILKTSEKDDDSGSVTEVIALKGKAVYENGAPVADADVRIRPAGFLAEFILPKRSESVLNTVTDEEGIFRVDSMDAGNYHIEINDEAGKSVLIKAEIPDEPGEVDLGPNILRSNIQVTGSVILPSAVETGVFVQVYGLDRVVQANPGTGFFLLGDLPADSFSLRIVCDHEGFDTLETVTPQMSPGDSVHLGDIHLLPGAGNLFWAYSGKFSINTSPSGADVAEDVHDFPLVLQFGPSNFDFGRARVRGGDIRFTKPDGTRLPHEIAYWHGDRLTGTVWVRVDTILGNDNTQYIMMFWGCPGAPEVTDGSAVFDTARGYVGAWHLGDSTGYQRKNSAQAAFAGQPQGYEGDEAMPGVIGSCDSLDEDDHISLGDIDLSYCSISAWVFVSEPRDYGRIIQKAWTGRPGEFYHQYGLSLYLADPLSFGMHAAVNDTVWGMASLRPLQTQTWIHLFMTYDGAELRLYLDGTPEVSWPVTGEIEHNDAVTYIGWNPDDPNQKLIGKIDEPRIENRARSAAWAKLSYENQRIGSNVVSTNNQ
jgi:hypothetical protein